MNKLEESRLVINEVDDQLVKLFEKRMKAVENVLAYKKENNLPIFDASREKANIEKGVAKLQDKNLDKYFVDFYQQLMDVSKDYQKDLLNKEN